MTQYKCIDNFGIEDRFTEGEKYEGWTYLQIPTMLSLADDKGVMCPCFPERFKEIIKKEIIDWDDYDEEANRRCTCSTSSMPPCSYCESGGFCQEHQEMRHDCGCEWDEEYEEY